MAVDAMKAGAFDFVQKPYKEQELLDRVQKAVNRSVTSGPPDAAGTSGFRDDSDRRTQQANCASSRRQRENRRVSSLQHHEKLESHSIAELTKKALISAST